MSSEPGGGQGRSYVDNRVDEAAEYYDSDDPNAEAAAYGLTAEEVRANFLLAEEEDAADGEVLFDEQELVPGQRDAERERAAFARRGINPDVYEEEGLEEEEEGLEKEDPRARRAAERRMDARDRLERAGRKSTKKGYLIGGVERIFVEEGDHEEELLEIERRRQRRREREERAAAVPEADGELIAEAKSLLRSTDPRVCSWDARLSDAVLCLFRLFLHGFEDAAHGEAGFKFYMLKLRQMQMGQNTALQVSTPHLMSFHCESFIVWIKHQPSHMLNLLDEIVTDECVRQRPEWYENRLCQVQLTEWVDHIDLRMLRFADLNTFIQTQGVVVKRSAVMPRLRELYLSCASCGELLNDRPFLVVPGLRFKPPGKCRLCGRGVFKLNRLKTLYQNFQKVLLQESPGSVPPGRSPRSLHVLLTGPLADSTKPGEEVQLVGVYKTIVDMGLNLKTGFSVLGTHVFANCITRKMDARISSLSQEEIKEIQKLSEDRNIRERIIASVAPSLWGHKPVKSAIAYAMFGGMSKGRKEGDEIKGGHTIRGDINVLLLGDPGLGKSQALQYVHQTFHRTVYTTGKGASAVGLTAGVKRDPVSGEWTLEGGALVLADEGICLIDEFDKMTEKDRVSIHEAMEQQSISISKAGIVAQLKARCAVIAAANPKFGRYEPSLTFKENVDLSDPILSRFDLICVLRDVPNFDSDYSLGKYVLANHTLSHYGIEEVENARDLIERLRKDMTGHMAFEPIPQELLQKYIVYAREKVRPSLRRLSVSSRAKIPSFYAQLRHRASRTGGLNMTLRHAESIVRIAEGNARMRLDNYVNDQDVDMAIATILDSFISSQKHSVAQSLGREFARYRALARGGYEMLGELARRQMQEMVARARKKQTTSSQDGTADFQVAQKLLSLDHFRQLAKQNKFTEYNINNWLLSRDFNLQFGVATHDGVDYIESKNFGRFSQQSRSTYPRHSSSSEASHTQQENDVQSPNLPSQGGRSERERSREQGEDEEVSGSNTSMQDEK